MVVRPNTIAIMFAVTVVQGCAPCPRPPPVDGAGAVTARPTEHAERPTTVPAPNEPRFVIALPGGRVAAIPAAIVEQHIDPGAVRSHAPPPAPDRKPFKSNSLDQEGEFHVDWEFGDFSYVDEAGVEQPLYDWHRHPTGTDYAELYE